MTNDELKDALIILRQRARHIFGTHHALWDLILDCEALLRGETTLTPTAQIIAAVEHELKVR